MDGRRRIGAVLTALAVSGGLFTAAGPAANAQARYYYNTWKNASGWAAPTPHDDLPIGTLYAGRNYFFCQRQNAVHPWTEGKYKNNWYLYTDLDTPRGAKGWISAVYVTVGGNWEPIPGLPRC
ncbi:hypothetical protein AB0D67_10445 [Streptosporangium sp. NPDC048047]|uniref:hypothetical protein n=1 Tax=Streptosporangium sp. NPDC048047 TaxID=3155748 RepID=UPI003423EA27